MTATRVCEHCGNPLGNKRAHARYCDSSCRADATRLRQELLGRSGDAEKALGSAQDAGAGSRGGNVRSVQEARDLQTEQREKRYWAAAIDEQIRRTLVETGYFHADDLDPLGVPPQHCNLKGTRTAWFRNQGFMEKSGVERKISHAAANGRKAAIHRITKKGRDHLLAGVDREEGVAADRLGDGLGGSVHSGENGSAPAPESRAGAPTAQAEGGAHPSAPCSAGAASPDQLHIGDTGKEKVKVGASSAYNPGNEWA